MDKKNKRGNHFAYRIFTFFANNQKSHPIAHPIQKNNHNILRAPVTIYYLNLTISKLTRKHQTLQETTLKITSFFIKKNYPTNGQFCNQNKSNIS